MMSVAMINKNLDQGQSQHTPLLNKFSQLASARKIGLVGGSFDPVHKAHLEIARVVKERYGLDAVVFIPAQQNPLKQSAPSASAEQRLEMLKLALTDFPDAYVSGYELSKPDKSFTVDTLEQIHSELPNAKLYWIGGTDNLIDKDPDKKRALAHWKNRDRILELSQIVTVVRNGISIDHLDLLSSQGFSPEQVSSLKQNILSVEPMVESSTEIRERLSQGQDTSRFLPAAVQSYIQRNNLYRGE